MVFEDFPGDRAWNGRRRHDTHSCPLLFASRSNDSAALGPLRHVEFLWTRPTFPREVSAGQNRYSGNSNRLHFLVSGNAGTDAFGRLVRIGERLPLATERRAVCRAGLSSAYRDHDDWQLRHRYAHRGDLLPHLVRPHSVIT